MKNYTKPEIIFDNFEFSENIAACELIDTGSSARYSCPIVDPESGWTIFQSNCSQTPSDGEQICYDVPLADYNVFIS